MGGGRVAPDEWSMQECYVNIPSSCPAEPSLHLSTAPFAFWRRQQIENRHISDEYLFEYRADDDDDDDDDDGDGDGDDDDDGDYDTEVKARTTHSSCCQ